MSLRNRRAPTAPRRTGGRRAGSWQVGAAAWPLLSLFLMLTTAVGAGVVVDRAGAARGASRSTFAALLLEDQTEWVVAPKAPTKGATAPPARFDLDLAVRDAPARATVEAVLYPRLRSRFALEGAVRSSPRGDPLASTAPVAYDTLPPDPDSTAAVSLDLSVVQTASTGERTRIGLACAPPTGTGTCTGVYPVVVELRRSGGKVVRRFTTFLTYVAGASAHPLELAWVVPVEAPVSLSPHPSDPKEGVEPISTADASALGALAAELRTSAVPVTLELSPETLQRLQRAGPGGRATVAALAGLSTGQATGQAAGPPAGQSRDEVLASPYVPVDLGALAGAGEPTEIVAQMAAGATVLRHLHVQVATSPSPWVQRGRVGKDIAGGLAEIGASQLVLPEADLAPTASTTDVGTWVSTFSLALSGGGSTGSEGSGGGSGGGSEGSGGGSTTSVQAAETDTWLDQQFTSHRGDPALAATQILADLAMVHFERPNTAAVRGMVALPPAGWVPNAVFTRVLESGLSQNPVVEPVTLSRFFGSVTPSGSRQLLSSGTGPVLERSLARAVSRARVRLSDFDDAVASRPPVLADLADLLLASEAEGLGPRRQATGVSTVEHLLGAQLGLVRFGKAAVTLTARTGWIPITIQSSAPYTLVGTLSVSGNKFVFLHKTGRLAMKLDHATNPARVDVRARTSGDLPLHVTFTSPDGRLVIAHGVLEVRSTATSLVGVVLTVVALAVLLAWWARTWRSGRRRRRLRRTGKLASGAAAP